VKRKEKKEREIYRKNPLKDKSVSKAIIMTDEAILGDKDDVTLNANKTESNNETKSEEETI
jgi:hypothetical protein